MREKVPFYLITGFLGSGKTTLLKKILRNFSKEKKIAVIENEFADSNIDSTELKQDHAPYKLIELNKGSVFCACLLPEFTKACAELGERYDLDAIILEATGLADPIAVAQVLRAPPLDSMLYLAGVVCIIDAVSFLKLEKSVTRMQHQVRVADLSLINKSDLVSPDVIDSIRERITDLNPFCKHIITNYCDFEPSAFFTIQELPVAHGSHGDSTSRPTIVSTVLRTTKKITCESLEVFASMHSELYRIKGFVQTSNGPVTIQYASGALQIIPTPAYTGPTELIALGSSFDPAAFERQYLESCL